MKKVKLLACMILFGSIIVGCSSEEKQTTTVCTGAMNGIDEKMTFKANGDEIEKQIEELELPMAELGMTEESMDTFMTEMLKEVYGAEDVEGTKGEYEVKDGVAYLTFTVDYTKADFEKLTEAGFIKKGLITTKYISLEKSIKAYKDQGLTCK